MTLSRIIQRIAAMAVTKTGVAIVEIETEKETNEEAEAEVGPKMTEESDLDDPDLEIEEIKALGTKNQNEAVEQKSRCIGMYPRPVLSTCNPCSTKPCRHQGKFLLLQIQKRLKPR